MGGRWVRWLRTVEPAPRHGIKVCLALAIVVAAIAATLRLTAAAALPVNWDEFVTLRAAHVYAAQIEAPRPGGIAGVSINNEHPPLAKLLYGLQLAGEERPAIPALRSGDPIPEALRDEWHGLRRTAALLGAAQAGGPRMDRRVALVTAEIDGDVWHGGRKAACLYPFAHEKYSVFL